eukprot:TRINITY_DN2569_c2_g1_i2.p1 TRINITY_DN2569_c2_g1~~TRINITY_DN2569_c2_g1_i2.p1  ORF type:complete len:135 (-),score=12.02 TRINITY_DN2569_c2_g1_i2:53-457(-)
MTSRPSVRAKEGGDCIVKVEEFDVRYPPKAIKNEHKDDILESFGNSIDGYESDTDSIMSLLDDPSNFKIKIEQCGSDHYQPPLGHYGARFSTGGVMTSDVDCKHEYELDTFGISKLCYEDYLEIAWINTNSILE